MSKQTEPINFIFDNNGIWTLPNQDEKEKMFYPEDGNKDSFELRKTSFWFKHRNDVILKVMNRFPFQSDFADIGGGNGNQIKFLSEKIENKNFYLIEPDYFGCINARKLGIEKVYNTIFENFPFEKQNIGGIGLFDVIEHIEEPNLFLKSLKQKLNPNTHIYITVPAYTWLWSDVDDFALHFTRYNKNKIVSIAEECNLSVIYNSYFFSYLTIPSFFLRALPYKIRGKRDNTRIIDKEIAQHKEGEGLSKKVIDRLNSFELQQLSKGKLAMGASLIAVLSN